MVESLVGQGRQAIDWIVDKGSFVENVIGAATLDAGYGPGAVAGTAAMNGREVTVLANDAQAVNERFPVVYFGVIGLEEAYKMAQVVYLTMEADKDKPREDKRPLILIVDTPGNGPGKVEEIVGMNKATGSYQLALAEARQAGHPIIAVVIGRAISGAFLCHGLQADHILALKKEYGTMIHVMPITSISRITKLDIETLKELSQSNPVFASGAEFFYQLGGVNKILDSVEGMRDVILQDIEDVKREKSSGDILATGPMGRGTLGAARGGRKVRGVVLEQMKKEFAEIQDEILV